MRRAMRVFFSTIAGVLLSAVVVYLSVLLSVGETTVGHAIDTVVTGPGAVFSAPFSYGTCPLFKQLFGWSGPGGAYMQILFVSFVTWALVFAVVAYVLLARRKPQHT